MRDWIGEFIEQQFSNSKLTFLIRQTGNRYYYKSKYPKSRIRRLGGIP